MFYFRPIYDNLVNYTGKNCYKQIILPFLKNLPENIWHPEYLQEIHNKEQVPQFNPEHVMGSFYFFHRFNELLLLSFQKPKMSKLNKSLNISYQNYIDIMSKLGLEICSYPKFLPILHQIVEVDLDPNPEKDIEVVAEIWPAVKLKNLVMSRAGCKVKAGKNKINREIAENSTLYWSHWRLD